MLIEFVTAYMLLWALAYAASHLPRFREKLRVVPFAVLLWRERPPKSLGRPASKRWGLLLDAGAVASFGMMLIALYILVKNLVSFAYEPAKAAPIIPLIPGVTIALESIPYFLIAFGIIAVAHEGAHMLAMRVENIRVRSFGVLVLAIMLGAFVEEDPDDMKKASVRTKLRIYGAGSASNIALFGLCLLLAYLFPLPRLLLGILGWIAFLSLFVAIFNMLPLHPFDGSYFLSSIVERTGGGVTKVVRLVATSMSVALMAANLALTFHQFGLIQI